MLRHTFPCLGRKRGSGGIPCAALLCDAMSTSSTLFCGDEGCDPMHPNLSIHPTRTVVINDIDFAVDPMMRCELGITHTVSVCPLKKDELKAIRGSSATAHHLLIPVQDATNTDLLSHLPSAIAWIRRALDSTPTAAVLIHCHMGISRSVTVACAFLMRVTGMTCGEALHHVQWKHRVANPNAGFLRQLSSFERTLNHTASRRTRRCLRNILSPEVLCIVASFIFNPRKKRPTKL